MKIKIIATMFVLLIAHTSFANQVASNQNDEMLIRSLTFSNILRNSSDEYLKLASSLDKDGVPTKLGSALVKASVVAELTLLAWLAGAPILAAVSNDVSFILASLGRVVAPPAVLLVGTEFAFGLSSKNSNFLNSEAYQEFKVIRDQILSEKKRDLFIRHQSFETVEVFKQLPKLEQLEYLEQKAQELATLSKFYRSVGFSLDKRLVAISEVNEPSKTYLGRLVTLGGDQIVYANTVVAGLIARSELSKFFLLLNEELITEYVATKALIQK